MWEGRARPPDQVCLALGYTGPPAQLAGTQQVGTERPFDSSIIRVDVGQDVSQLAASGRHTPIQGVLPALVAVLPWGSSFIPGAQGLGSYSFSRVHLIMVSGDRYRNMSLA